jgi:DNA replicative helicase MCM subunit Mcm2 (Cdc46/Mcm family)
MDDEDNNSEIPENESSLVYLQKNIEYSKRFQPKFSDEAKFMLKEYYLAVRAKYGSRRVWESIVTIARMTAQLKLKAVIDAEDAKETLASLLLMPYETRLEEQIYLFQTHLSKV